MATKSKITSTNRFKPLPPRERAVCLRLADCRRYARLSAAEFAAAIQLTPAQLANLEAARVPVRFWTGWRACARLNINQRWLSNGTEPQKPFLRMDINKSALEIGENALFSAVCDNDLSEDLEFRSELVWSIGQYQASGDATARGFGQTLGDIIKTYLDKIPAGERKAAARSALSMLNTLVPSLPEGSPGAAAKKKRKG